MPARNRTIGFVSSGMITLLASAVPLYAATATAPHEFTISISLSKKAEAKLHASGEGITLLASYYGDPHKGSERHSNEMGLIDLGTETIERNGSAGQVAITGKTVRSDRLSWIKGNVKVNVNLFSSRKKFDDNIISCDVIDGTVSELRSPVSVHCTLIDENVDPAIKP